MQTHTINEYDHHKTNNIIIISTTQHNHNTAAAPQPRTTTTSQACAACKYRRRKCSSDCILSPYFPQDRQPHFLNAHRLFGVSNIVKIIQHLSQPERDLAMRTILFESDAHAADAAGGCFRIIRELELRISLAKAELQVVLHHLAICRAAAAAQGQLADARDFFDVDSWGCMNENFQCGNAESTSSSSLSHHESTNDVIKPILHHLGCDDFRVQI